MTFGRRSAKGAHSALHQRSPFIRETQAQAVRASPTASVRAHAGRVWLHDLRRRVIIGVLAGVFLGFAGAFSTNDAALPVRLAYWTCVCLLGSLAGAPVMALATRAPALSQRRWVLAALAFALLTLILTPVIWAVTRLVLDRDMDLSSLPAFAAPVAAVTAAMTTLSFALNRAPVQTHATPPSARSFAPEEPPAPAQTTVAAKFLDRLPPKLREADLFGVESEDHYLRLHTSRGQDLILMRLSDALTELDGLEGAQTHRSWWVARDGFDSAHVTQGRALLRLKNGVEAPVSRTYAKALRLAGWF